MNARVGADRRDGGDTGAEARLRQLYGHHATIYWHGWQRASVLVSCLGKVITFKMMADSRETPVAWMRLRSTQSLASR